MKMTRKLVITSLSLLVGASVAGSVIGTSAWFQYATKAQVAYTGSTSHCSKLLRISVDNGSTWGNDITSSAFNTVKFSPITTGAQLKNANLTISNGLPVFYGQPNYRQGAYTNWFTASEDSYAQFTVLIKVNDVDGASTPTQLENDVYLTDLTIQDATTGGAPDLSEALRVHIATSDSKYFLFAKNSTSTAVGGYLDINNDNKYDTEGYEWNSTPIVYGEENAVQTSYKATDSSIIAAEAADGSISGGTAIGSTKASGYLEVTVTIWLEGWALLQTGIDHASQTSTINKTNTSIWDSTTYINKKFNVGLTFGVNLHSDADHPQA